MGRRHERLSTGRAAAPAREPAGDLTAICCSGCGAHLSVAQLSGAAHSSHIGRLHEGCLGKGTWRGQYQLGLELGDSHG